MSSNPRQRDIERLRAIAGRDRAAFGELFREWYPRIRGFMAKGARDAEHADELAQEVFLRVWRRAGSYKPRNGAPSTWMFTIARNVRTDAYRRNSRPEVDWEDPTLVPPAEGPERATELGRRSHRLELAIAELPESQQSALRAAYFEGLTMRAIAERSGTPLGTIKSRVRLALRRLRDALDEQVDP